MSRLPRTPKGREAWTVLRKGWPSSSFITMVLKYLIWWCFLLLWKYNANEFLLPRDFWSVIFENLFFLFSFFLLFRPAPAAYMEVPRLGVRSELQLLVYTTAASATYTTAHGNTRSLTHWARPGMEPTSSWILVGFISAVPQHERLNIYFSLFAFHSWPAA